MQYLSFFKFGNKGAIAFVLAIIGIITLVTGCNQAPIHEKINLPKVEPVEIKPAIRTIVDSIATYNQLNSAHVGFAGIRTVQWDRFEKLSTFATLSELRELTHHKNAVVRCYAFDILTARKDTACFKIALAHLRDTGKVSTLIGCMGFTDEAGNYFLRRVKRSDSTYTGFRLSDMQAANIDSVLLYGENIHLAAKYSLIEELKPLDRYYERVRELAIKKKVPEAIWALSKYKRQSDVNIITNAFDRGLLEDYALHAVIEMPDNSLYANVVSVFEQEWKDKSYDYSKWRLVYQALAQYPLKPQTFALFKQTIQTKDKFRRKTLGADLLVAITRYPNPVFEPLKKQIKLDGFELEEVKEELNRK